MTSRGEEELVAQERELVAPDQVLDAQNEPRSRTPKDTGEQKSDLSSGSEFR